MNGRVIYLDNERLLRSYDKIGNAIVEYINDMGLTWEIEIAKKVYFGKYIYIIESDMPNFCYKRFIQWLIFSYKLHNGLSLIECIYDKYLDDKNHYDKNTLYNLKNSWESLYKVYDKQEDRILVKDIFSNEKLYLCDSTLINNVKRYSGIFTRVMWMNNALVPIPGYAILTNSFLKDMEQYVREKFMEISKYKKNISIKDFINTNNLMLHRYLLHFSF